MPFSGAVLLASPIVSERVIVAPGFDVTEAAYLLGLPCVNATKERPAAQDWDGIAWVRCGTGPLTWWLTCACSDLWSHYSSRLGRVYYRHGDDLLKSTVNALDFVAINRWAERCPHGEKH